MERGAAAVALELAQALNAYEAEGGSDPLLGVIVRDEFRPYVDLDASDTNFARPNGRWMLVVTDGREVALVDGQPQRQWALLDRAQTAEKARLLIQRADRPGVRRDPSSYFQCAVCAVQYREGSGFCIECGAKRDTRRFAPARVARGNPSGAVPRTTADQLQSPSFEIREVDYLGSHPGHPNWFPRAHLVLNANGMRFDAVDAEPPQTIAMGVASILGVEVMSAAEARVRVLAPRVLLLAGLTAAEDQWRERDLAFLSVRTDTGDIVFRARGLTPDRLRAAIRPFADALPRWARAAPAAAPPSAPAATPIVPEGGAAPSVDDIEARLQKLDQLLERGLLSDDEHERRRNDILDQI